MGLFDKLFGGNKAASVNEARAQFRNEKYFDKQIARWDLFIKSDSEDFDLYIKKHGALNSQHYLTATEVRNKKVETLYSKGDPIQALIPVYEDSLQYFLQSWSREYTNNLLAVQMLSFCILLQLMDKYGKDFNAFVDRWEANDTLEEAFKPQPLVYFLLGRKAPVERIGYEPLNKLYEITQLPKDAAEREMKEYLQQWYAMHKDQPWYNTHLRENGYSGYWAWEVAAVVKLLQLNDESFKDNPFYPYDIVHWEMPVNR